MFFLLLASRMSYVMMRGMMTGHSYVSILVKVSDQPVNILILYIVLPIFELNSSVLFSRVCNGWSLHSDRLKIVHFYLVEYISNAIAGFRV
jgi:hypothetical protein